MAVVAPKFPVIAGTMWTLDAAVDGDSVLVGSGYFLHAKNTNAATRTITITPAATLPTGASYPAKVYTLAALTGEMFIPLIKDFKGADGRHATLVYSATSGVTRALVKAG